jgi:hypothetical protein
MQTTAESVFAAINAVMFVLLAIAMMDRLVSPTR